MTNITPIIEAILMLCAAVITVFVIPNLKGRLSVTNLENMRAWAKIAVAAAEQLYNVVDGDKKKEYVVEFLKSKGFGVDMDALDKVVEAEVLKLHRALKEGYDG